jgi:hypothetical protein
MRARTREKKSGRKVEKEKEKIKRGQREMDEEV